MAPSETSARIAIKRPDDAHAVLTPTTRCDNISISRVPRCAASDFTKSPGGNAGPRVLDPLLDDLHWRS